MGGAPFLKWDHLPHMAGMMAQYAVGRSPPAKVDKEPLAERLKRLDKQRRQFGVEDKYLSQA